MNWKRTARWSLLVLPFLLLGIWPSVAAAQLGVADANALLYEVTESLKLKPLASGQRIATAALAGTVNLGTSICPSWLAYYLGITVCNLNATGSDKVDLATAKGPFEGTFEVVINTAETNPVDGPELVILRGTFHGRIDFSPALFGPDGIPNTGDELPIGFLKNGRWEAKGVEGGPLAGIRARGTLTGTFRQPVGTVANAFYFTDIGFVPVDPNERSLGWPTVRMEIKFVDHAGDSGD